MKEGPMISLPAAEDDILITVQYDATGLASATMMDNVLLGWLVPEVYAVAASTPLGDRPLGEGQPPASIPAPQCW
jgi:hypothetical protein